MMGLLGFFGWEVTVISSNFISLQLIITMAITIHLIVRYRELHAENPEADQRELVLRSVCLMLRPCLYAGLTTIAGFGSLVLCDILPVITFGWMMIGGIIVSLIVTFMLFPALLMLTKKGSPPAEPNKKFSLTDILARFTESRGNLILSVSLIVLIISAAGISRLAVENCFIDYFKKTTEIYQGMKVIDQKLGGTTPLDVIVAFGSPEAPASPAVPETDMEEDDGFDDFDDFEILLIYTPKLIETLKSHYNPSAVTPAAEMSDQDTLPESGTTDMLETDDLDISTAPAVTSTGNINIDMLLDVPLDVTIELGRSVMSIRKILELGPGSIVELDRKASEPVNLLVGDKIIAKGEVVVVDEYFGIRIVTLVSPEERIKHLR